MTNTEPFVTWWLTMRQCALLLDRAAEEATTAASGLSLTQFAVLKALDTEDDCLNQQDLVDVLAVTKSTISRQIETVLDAGLVELAPVARSRRERRLRLTQAGQDAVRRADAAICAAQQPVAEAFSDADLAVANTTAERLRERLGAVSPAGGLS